MVGFVEVVIVRVWRADGIWVPLGLESVRGVGEIGLVSRFRFIKDEDESAFAKIED